MKNLLIKTKLKITSAVIIIGLTTIGSWNYYKISEIQGTYENNSEINALNSHLQSLYKNGLQIGQAARNVHDYKKVQSFTGISKGITKFNLGSTYDMFYKNTLLLIKSDVTKDDIINSTAVWRPFKASTAQYLIKNKEKQEDNKAYFNTLINDLMLYNTIIILLVLIISAVILFLISRDIRMNISKLVQGANSFFNFLNKKTDHFENVTDYNPDEIGEVIKLMNVNAEQISSGIKKDNDFLNAVQKTVHEISQGNIASSKNTINISEPNAEALLNLKGLLQDLIEALIQNISSDTNTLMDALQRFKDRDFRGNIPDDSVLSTEINAMITLIKEMINKNKEYSGVLNENSKNLSDIIQELSRSSNEAAVHMEETAASTEEISTNANNNKENVLRMAENANKILSISNSNKDSTELLSTAMLNIENEVNEVIELVKMIDKIAFQTNILSLNAAVEAATAGEAGKGFAVVAGEVRNLASRSAEAAKEIKEAVEQTLERTLIGKKNAMNISSALTELNALIQENNTNIEYIKNSTEETNLGITQISASIQSLDAQTQKNASMASDMQEVAKNITGISDEMLIEANKSRTGENNGV
jgi:methyl-accepting chemotaxis protein